ncbi:MAG: hypothetical protein B6D35_12920, partial [Candidatus Brocadia sp. UTAMX2]
SQKSRHVIPVHLYAKLISYKNSYTRPSPKIRGKTIISCWLPQEIHQFKDSSLFQFRWSSCCLSGFQFNKVDGFVKTIYY